MTPADARCHHCDRVTATELLPLSSGHIGNVCAVCHTCRRGRPYVSRHVYETSRTDARSRANGEPNDLSRR